LDAEQGGKKKYLKIKHAALQKKLPELDVERESRVRASEMYN